jgi:hypothetical protein
MKSFLLSLLLVFIGLNLPAQTNPSKVIYSNGLTHCSVIAVAVNDSTVMYNVCESSDRHFWRLTDRSEMQSLGLMDKETVVKLFNTALTILENQEVGYSISFNKNLKLTLVDPSGIRCLRLENTLVDVSFNINKKNCKRCFGSIVIAKKNQKRKEDYCR